jgi:hypothetical protein
MYKKGNDNQNVKHGGQFKGLISGIGNKSNNARVAPTAVRISKSVVMV